MTDSLERTDADRFKIERLLDLVRTGQIRIPRFQRGIRWNATDVERLFDSIYRGYPIGTLLFWERAADADDVQIGPLSLHAPASSSALWVVDGQQRITSLAAALLPVEGRGLDPRFELAFDLAREQFVKPRAHETRETLLPVRSAFDLQHVLSWLRDRHLPGELQDRAFRLADRLRNYEVPAYIVKTDDEDALRQIFDRTNTFGKRMTRAEVFHALHTAPAEKTTDLRALADEVNASGFGSFDDNTLLFCVLGVRDPDVLRDFHTEFDAEDELQETFRRARAAIRLAIAFLREDAEVPHLSLVPYQHLTVTTVRYFALHPEPSSWERVLLRRWFWRSAVHGPIPRQGPTGTLRAMTKAVVEADAQQSLENLLALVPSDRRTAEVGLFRWNVADVRITVAALAARNPIDLVTGDELVPGDLIERLQRDALAPLVPLRTRVARVHTTANRVFTGDDGAPEHGFEEPPTGDPDDHGVVSPAGPSGEDERQLALLAASADVLASHAIPTSAVEALQAGDQELFLQRRYDHLQGEVGDFVDARAEWERPTRPAVAQLRLQP